MHIVFAYDVTIEYDIDDGLFYHNYFDNNIWGRYLNVFDEITVISRIKNVNKITRNHRKQSCGDRVKFTSVPSISDPISMFTKRTEVIQKVSESLATADGLIARLPSEIGVLAIQVAEKLRKPWAVEVVGHVWDALWNHGSWQGKVYAPLATLQTRLLIKKAKYALYVTNGTLQKIYPTKGVTIHCSNVEIPSIPDDVLNKRIDKIKNRGQTYKIGLIGSMNSKYKGIDVAIRSLSKIKDKIPFELLILGEGDPQYYRNLARDYEISDSVTFSGTLPSGELVFKWLDQLDLYIQPSFQEGLPRALIEAMSRGLPSLGSSVGGIPELLPSTSIIKPGDFDKLSDLILQAYREGEWQLHQARYSVETAGQYSKEVLDRRRTEFWQSFVAQIQGKVLLHK